MNDITTQQSATQTGNSILNQLNSGTDGVLDVEKVVESLLLGETGVQINSINRDVENLKEKQTAFELLGSALTGFDGIMDSLSGRFQDISKSATVANEGVATVSVSDEVADGSYSLEVLSLASKQSVSSVAYSSANDVVGTGTIDVETGSYASGAFVGNGDTVSISVGGGTTVSQLVEQINSSGAGVTAYLINTGSGYQIAMSSKGTGESSGFSLSVTDSDGNSTDATGLSSFQYNDATKNMSLNQSASDAQALFDGVLVRSGTNTFDNVVDGFNFTVRETNIGSPTIIDVANDVASAKEVLMEFVDSYNAVADVMDYLSGEEVGEESQGALFRDRDFRLVERGFRDIADKYVAGYGGEAILNELGVRFIDDNTGRLELNEDIFASAIAADGDIVKNAVSQIGTTTDPNITFMSATSDTLAGLYSPINITSVASSATLVNGFAASLLIDGNSDEFSATVNGESTGSIFLTTKLYANYGEMALEIQNKMNDALSSTSVSVIHNGSGFEISNNVLGSASNITIDSVDVSFTATTGISNGASASGTDVVGNVGGDVAIGTGTVLEVVTGNGRGMKLQVDAVAPGSYGDVTMSDGVGKSFSDLIGSFFESQGLYTQVLQQYESVLDDKAERLKKLEVRTEELRVRYSIQYSTLNSFIIAMDQTSSQLQSQFDAWSQG